MEVFPTSFARVYNNNWGTFAEYIAPRIYELYEGLLISEREKTLFDLCCGTGQLARFFLDRGYRVIGSDLSEAMLEYARINNDAYLSSGHARFFQADATEVESDEKVGLVVATGEALNHLQSHEALKDCFESVLPLLAEGGIFVFDLRTTKGFSVWNDITVEGNDSGGVIVKSGVYAGNGEAVQRIIGFDHSANDSYKRFEQVVHNVVFSIDRVQTELRNAGFTSVSVAPISALSQDLDDPEAENRIVLIAKAN